MNNKNKKRLIIISIIFLIILFFRFSGFYKFFTFENFVKNREYFLTAVNKNYFFSIIIYFALYILIVISTFPLAGLLTVFGGFLFGVFPGTIFAVIAGTIGSAFSFLIFRYFFGKFVQEKYSHRLEKFNKNIEYYGSIYILMIQLIGIVPFFVVNILASLTKIPLRTFLWTTAIGIIPMNFIYAYAGRQLGTINSFKEILSPKVLLAFALLSLLSLISILIKRHKKSKV